VFERGEDMKLSKELTLNNMEKNQLIENLKCCGNCLTPADEDCAFIMSACDAMNYCDKWKYDGMTRDERLEA
jgi:hypothetical protein